MFTLLVPATSEQDIFHLQFFSNNVVVLRAEKSIRFRESILFILDVNVDYGLELQ